MITYLNSGAMGQDFSRLDVEEYRAGTVPGKFVQLTIARGAPGPALNVVLSYEQASHLARAFDTFFGGRASTGPAIVGTAI